jgi:hypothetical protein
MARLPRLVFISFLFSATAYGAQTYVPEPLQGWQQWVLKDREYLGCPFYFTSSATDRSEFICAWPGQLDLRVSATGARFSQQWTVYAAGQWLELAGDTSYWPHRVTANGRDVPVVLHNGSPSLYLGPGSYRVAGSFEWDERPGALRIPASSGLVALYVDDRRIARPERSNTGIFLGERQRESQARDAVTATVYRLVADDVPTRLATTLRIDVSGGVREELFGPLLPQGFVPLGIDSALPARLEPDGKLRVQVRPGRWVVKVTARGAEVLNEVTMPAPEANLPDSEIWSYQSNDRLRVTAAAGPAPVDPAQVQAPDEWQRLPAFRIRPGESLTVTERSRGIVSADNELSLVRRMWLDFSGEGFVVSDDIGGTMRSGWRLDMAPPFALLNASESGDNLLITDGSEEGRTGVELRRPDVDLGTLGRAETRGTMPVTGWSSRFASVSTVLQLPPGDKLLAAPGADRAPGSWVSRWKLLDFFLLLIITIGTWRLFGRGAGLVALFALILSYQEPGAPSWLWLNLLVATALMRVAPDGRLRLAVRSYQALSAVILVLVLVPFLASQLRIAIYPQLEPQRGVPAAHEPGVVAPAVMAPKKAPEEAAFVRSMVTDEARRNAVNEPESLEEIVVTGSRASQDYARYAPNAIVQAGPGMPSWEWNSYRLSWSGPVDAGQTLRLVILPRWAVTGLRFVEVLALLLFAAVFAAEILRRRIALPGGFGFGAATAGSLVAVGLLSLLLGAVPVARAQTPDPELLRDLEKRLTQPPDCAPRCAEIVAAQVDVDPHAVSMRLTVHALADVAVPLPGSEKGWRPVAVLLDGTASGEVFRAPDQALWVRLGAGRHSIDLAGEVPEVDSLEVPFPTPPRVIEVAADGWFIAGVRDRRLLSGSLQLTRLQSAGDGSASPRWESSRFPAFARIERSVELDLDWRATTTVFRIAPEQGALTLEVPLLEGEAVVTDGFTVNDGKLLVSMSPDQRAVSWRSNLPRHSPLLLTAGASVPWQEVWRVGVGSVWHAEFSGVPESENPDAASGVRVAEFFPRGGETLAIEATRPEASAGSTLAFDAVTLGVEIGARTATATLELKYRSTRGAQHVIRLPADAEVTAVAIDYEVQPLRAENGELTVPILPGEHDVSIQWRTPGTIGLRAATPQVDIGAPSSNIGLRSTLPYNRWLLATNGPKLGPAVLYWSELAVLLLFALILGRIRLTPLRTHHWLLLGLGFSTFNWPVLGVVAAWLLACGARQKWESETVWWRFNLVQVAIGAATVIALLSILASLPSGLLGTPDMHVTGNDSYGNSLLWFADSSAAVLPTAVAWSVPMWIYKLLILAWALWLSFALIRWLPWVWQCFSSRGFWRSQKAAAIRGE